MILSKKEIWNLRSLFSYSSWIGWHSWWFERTWNICGNTCLQFLLGPNVFLFPWHLLMFITRTHSWNKDNGCFFFLFVHFNRSRTPYWRNESLLTLPCIYHLFLNCLLKMHWKRFRVSPEPISLLGLAVSYGECSATITR